MNSELLNKLRVCLQNGDIPAYLLLLEKEALNSDVEVWVLEELGKYYLLSTYPAIRNLDKAKIYFDKACLRNSGPAFYYLGYMYYRGTACTERDINKAIILLEKACDLGEYSGAVILGNIYQEGIEIEADEKKAKEFFQKAMSVNMGFYQYASLCLFDNEITFDDFKNLSGIYQEELSSPYAQKYDQPFVLKNIALLKNAVNTDKTEENLRIWDLKDLLAKLEAEHVEGFYYRGQNKRYPGPLCASLERNKYSKYPIYYDGDCRLRKYGHIFYFEDRCYMNAKHKWSEEKKLQYLLNSYIRQAFGYSLTMALTQQAGYQSEGLDVTFSIDIALFFASYLYDKGKYLLAKGDSENAVIYRWKNLKKNSFNTTLQSGYFNSPPLIPTYEIFESLQKCTEEETFYESVRNYAEAIAWGTDKARDYTNHFGSLPFDLLKIPVKYWENSRIYKQKAGLLLRDYVISQPKREAYFNSACRPCHDFPYMTDLDLNLSHDLSDSYICETFIFKKDPDYAKLYLESKGITPSFIYDSEEDDLSHILLSGWIENYYKDSHQYGTPVIDLSPHSSFNINYYKLMDLLHEYRANRSKYQYYFRPIE